MFGKLLHVVVTDAGADGPAVQAALERTGIRVDRLEKILPSLEDVFVSLIEAEDRAESRAPSTEHRAPRGPEGHGADRRAAARTRLRED
jgi:hypothetical protein